MTNDKDCAALLRDVVQRFLNRKPFGCTETTIYFEDRVSGGEHAEDLIEEMRKAIALKSHGQAFDAAGVVRWLRNHGYKQVKITLRLDGGYEVDFGTSTLIEAPASFVDREITTKHVDVSETAVGPTQDIDTIGNGGEFDPGEVRDCSASNGYRKPIFVPPSPRKDADHD